MNNPEIETLKSFLETASKEDCLRAFTFHWDEISACDGFLPVDLGHNGSIKTILFEPSLFKDKNGFECREIALMYFCAELKINR